MSHFIVLVEGVLGRDPDVSPKGKVTGRIQVRAHGEPIEIAIRAEDEDSRRSLKAKKKGARLLVVGELETGRVVDIAGVERFAFTIRATTISDARDARVAVAGMAEALEVL
jgi:hypothetical protein